MSNEDGELLIDAINARLYSPMGVHVYIGWTCHRILYHHGGFNSWMTVCGDSFGPAGNFRETLDPLTCIRCAADAVSQTLEIEEPG